MSVPNVASVPALIGSTWEAPTGDLVFPSLVDPNTGAPISLDNRSDVLLTVRDCSQEQIDRAIALAQAFDPTTSWGAPLRCDPLASLLHRYDRLLQLVEQMEREHDEFALIDAIETGVPLSTTMGITLGYGPAARAFLASALTHLRGLVEGPQSTLAGRYQAPIVRRVVPLSPAVIIAPWNVPFGTVLPKIFVAMLCGCAVLLKPSEYASRGICLMVQRFTESGGLPCGALQVLVGGPVTGKALVSSKEVHCVQFTGATRTAATIGAVCASFLRPFHAECGGSNAALIGPSADLDLAVRCITMGLTMLNGQWCMGISRIIVHSDVFPQFLQKLQSRLNDVVRVVSSTEEAVLQEGTDSTKVLVGPMAFAAHATRLEELCRECGGEVLLVGELPDDLKARMSTSSLTGFFQPRLLLHPDNAVIAHRELFGPVAGITSYDGTMEDVGTALVNEASGQLAAYVFDQDVEHLYRSVAPRINAGMVMMNSVNFGFEVEEGLVEPHGDFLGTAGHGRDGNGKALAAFFTASAWMGVNGPSS